MIYTVTLNPCIDWHAASDITPGTIHRFENGYVTPGGKGINVSLMLTALGEENTALGFAAGFTGREIVRLLDEAGCASDLIFLESGFSRINLNITDPVQGETNFNGAGPDITGKDLQKLEEKLAGLRPGDVLVLAGSVPASVSADVYARLVKAAPQGVLTVVDASGAALEAAVKARPFLIKPNVQELGALFNAEITGMEGAMQCSRALQEQGARNIVVSMGARGALLVKENGQYFFCHSAQGEAVSTLGAGDSLVAGLLYGYRLHGRLEAALRWGVAAGAATAFSKGIAGREKVIEAFTRTGNVNPV